MRTLRYFLFLSFYYLYHPLILTTSLDARVMPEDAASWSGLKSSSRISRDARARSHLPLRRCCCCAAAAVVTCC